MLWTGCDVYNHAGVGPAVEGQKEKQENEVIVARKNCGKTILFSMASSSGWLFE
jgi:hypothetical protein